MQIKKENVKELVLKTAKKEFLKNGFEKSSLRTIAERAGVTKGNIYVYFKSKDELFIALVKPAMEYIKRNMEVSHDDEYFETFSDLSNFSLDVSRKEFEEFISGVFDYEDEFRLLFFCSSGSSYQNFKEEIFKLYEESSQAFLDDYYKTCKCKEKRISDMFVHTLASLYLQFIEEILIHEPSDEELSKYIYEISTMVHAGYATLLK